MRCPRKKHLAGPVPRLARAVLTRLVPFENRDSILGDYEETCDELARRKGLAAARLWYVAQVFKSLPMLAANLISRSAFMIKTDLKLAVRSILKSKGFSFLNVAGLALGMAVGFLMLLFVLQETSYDRFHEKGERIYRFSDTLTIEGRQMNLLGVPGPLAPLLKERFPEVLNATRLRPTGSMTVALADKNFDIDRLLYADEDFFKVFTARVLQGDRGKMLETPFSLVLTDETARRLFGREDPVGKVVLVGAKDPYTVTGVVKKFPANSHLQFDALVSLSTREKLSKDVNTWNGGFNYMTYLELRPGVLPDAALPKFQQALQDNLPSQIKAMNVRIVLGLQPLTRIHLHSNTQEEFLPPGNPAYIRVLTMIAFFILLLAGINFVTLSTARAGRRAKEVGMRKVLGAERARLIGQFLGESVLFSVISLALAVGLIYLLLPLFNRLIAQNLSFSPFASGTVLPGLLGMALLVGLLAGLYPAFVLSGFSPQHTMKSSADAGSKRRLFRRGLVVFQYVVSIALICCTLIVHDQLRFVRNYDLGFNQAQLVDIPLSRGLIRKPDLFKEEVLRIPGVEKAVLCNNAPFNGSNQTLFRFEGAADRLLLPRVDSDGDYVSTLGLSLAAGRDFDKNLPTDRDSALLNETLVRQMGWKDPLGKIVKMLDSDNKGQLFETPFTVIGVIKDYHFESLHQPLRGQVIMNRKKSIRSLLVRLRPGAIPGTMAEIQRVWKKLEPGRSFDYVFQSQSFDRLYRSEQRLGQVFIFFTALALFVAGLGLFGLAAFTAERRTKEIGIRKVLGASTPGLMTLLTREFVGLVLLASLVAWPVAFLTMKSWTQGFAYRVAFHPLLFLAAGAAAALLAVLTTGMRTAKSAAANPVDSLKYE